MSGKEALPQAMATWEVGTLDGELESNLTGSAVPNALTKDRGLRDNVDLTHLYPVSPAAAAQPKASV